MDPADFTKPTPRRFALRWPTGDAYREERPYRVHWWRIEDGIPSVADALFVASAAPCGFILFVLGVNPFISFFESRGWPTTGCIVALGGFVALLAGGVGTFVRAGRKLRSELALPRYLCAVAAKVSGIVLLFHSDLRPQDDFFFSSLFWELFLLIVVNVIGYVLVMKLALRWPQWGPLVAACCLIGLQVVGVVAKFLNLINPHHR